MDPVLLAEILSVLMFVVVIPALMLGYPVAFTLAGVGLAFGLLGHALGVFDLTYFNALPLRYWGIVSNEVLIAVPLFVVMGVTLERSGIAEDLLRTLGEVFGALRGGLGFSVILVGSLLAAATGIVGATVTTMALISLPVMLTAGYQRSLASGLICATGSLAQIIPPSTVLVFLAAIMQALNSQVQMAKGNFSPTALSVGDLFAAAFLPGLLLSVLYAAWLVLLAVVRPETCPPLPRQPRPGLHRRVIIALVPAVVLIVSVLGSIIAGVATPTEAAAVGAVGAFLLTAIRTAGEELTRSSPAEGQEAALYLFWLGLLGVLGVLAVATGAFGVLSLAVALLGIGGAVTTAHYAVRARLAGLLSCVAEQSLTITVMVFVIFFGATVFSLVFTRMGGDDLVADVLGAMPGGMHGAIGLVMVIMFVLGMFLDTFEILFIVVPIAAPVLLHMGAGPLWLSVLIAICLQTSYLTPPFGFSLFFLRGVAPPEVHTSDIYRGIVPFVALQLVALAAVWLQPQIALWLPSVIYR